MKYDSYLKNLEDTSNEDVKKKLEEVCNEVSTISDKVDANTKEVDLGLEKLKKSTKYVNISSIVALAICILTSLLLVIEIKVLHVPAKCTIINGVILAAAYIIYQIIYIKHTCLYHKYNKLLKEAQALSDDCKELLTVSKILSLYLDKNMYKDIYMGAFKIQEYLKENDKKGYNSFIKAAEELKIDFSEYIKKD